MLADETGVYVQNETSTQPGSEGQDPTMGYSAGGTPKKSLRQAYDDALIIRVIERIR